MLSIVARGHTHAKGAKRFSPGISLLRSHPQVDPKRIGILGHSYGGNTVLVHGHCLFLSAAEDQLSFDADRVVLIVQDRGAASGIEHKRYAGGHALTQERFDDIVRWLLACIS